MKYGQIRNGKLKLAEREVKIGDTYYPSPTEEQYRIAGYKPIVDVMPSVDETQIAIARGWRDEEDRIVRLYEVRERELTIADYDAAMEDHIRAAREARGYTTREPSEYANSSVARWSQDARDYIAFRDEVMLVGLRVINEYAESGKAPSLAEFRAMLPTCKWTEV